VRLLKVVAHLDVAINCSVYGESDVLLTHTTMNWQVDYVVHQPSRVLCLLSVLRRCYVSQLSSSSVSIDSS